MTSTALARTDEFVAEIVSDVVDRRQPQNVVVRRLGVGQALSETTVSLPIVGFVALGSALAGFVVGVAVCDILERG
jgi:hypothetical protein